MPKSFREAIESILFVGMKPGAPPSAPKVKRWYGPLLEPLERFLSGGSANDPLYISNRTWSQRIRFWLLLAAPFALVGGMMFAVFGFVRQREAVPQEVTPAQRAAALLPRDLDRNFAVVNVHPDLDVLEVKVDRNGPLRLVGTVRNRTERTLAHAEVFFDLADAAGSRVGSVSVELEKVPPLGIAPFTVPVSQDSAVIALVREVRAQ